MPREVFIVGGGPSLSGFDFRILDGKDTIVVNQALFRLPSAKYFVTMDYTWRQRLDHPGQEENKRQFLQHQAQKIFVVGFSAPRLVVHSDHIVEDSVHGLRYNLSDFNQTVFCSAYGGLGFTWDDFHVGSESGYSGLQLAAILGYSRIYLLGFDFRISPYQTHFHQDYPPRDILEFMKRLEEYYQPYPQALFMLQQRGVEVFSCSPISRLNSHLLYVDPENLVQAR